MTKWTNNKLQKLQNLRNEGLTVDQIADRLNMKPRTVRYCFERIHKLQRAGKFELQQPSSPKSSKSTEPVAKRSTTSAGTTSTAMVKVQAGEEMDEDYLLRAHGFSPDAWKITSTTSNYWGRDADGYRQFQTKIKVAPKGFDPNDIVKVMNEKIEAVKLPESKRLTYGSDNILLVPLFDLHFGITTYKDMTDYMADIVKVMSNGYKEIVIVVGGDLFHSDYMNKSQTASNTQLDHVNNVQAFKDAKQFLEDLIRRAYDFTQLVTVYSIPGNHDSDKAFMFMQSMKERYRSTLIKFVITTKPRIAFKVNNVGIMLHHGDVTKMNKAPLLFASEFQDVWSQTKTHVIFSGHYHSQKTQDELGTLEFQLGTPKKADNYEKRNGYLSQRKLQLFDFSPDALSATYYIQH